MKKLMLLFLLAIPLFAQNTQSTRNSSITWLDSAAVFTGTPELISIYNTVSTTIRSNVGGTLKMQFGIERSRGVYFWVKTYTFAYTANDTAFTKSVPVDAPYFRVVYTNGATDQTSFALTTMYHAESNAPTATDGKLEISGSTSNGSLEATQLQVLSELQNKINMGGTQTYSLRRQDFTATLKAGGKSIAVTGLNGGTLSYLNFAYGYLINSTTGAKTYLTNAVDSVAGTSIRFPSATAFTATDVLGELVFIYPEKVTDKANDANKSLEQAPLWARYQIEEIYDGTNLAAGTNYYPSSTGASMDGYKNLSFTSNLVDADGTITYTLEVTNDEDLTNATWMQVYGYDATLNSIVNSLSVTNGTLNSAWDFDDLNCNAWRVKVVTSGSTNTIVIKSRRTF